MNKKLLTEVFRQKELMNLNEQGLNIMSGLGDKLASGLLKNLFKDTFGLEDFESETQTNDSNNNDFDTENSINKVSVKGQELLNNPIFKNKLKEISQLINIPESSIIKLMKHESGLNPLSKNSIGCVGLIQFCPGGGSTKIVNGKSYSLEELRNNLDIQMDAIRDFWLTGYKMGKIKKPADLYIYNFFPVAAGKPDDFILQSKNLSAKTVAKANPLFNRTLGKEISSPLTVGDLKQYYQKTGMV